MRLLLCLSDRLIARDDLVRRRRRSPPTLWGRRQPSTVTVAYDHILTRPHPTWWGPSHFV